MTRIRVAFAAVSAVAVLLAGCGNREKADPVQVSAVQKEYQRIAIVCAPAAGADAKYAPAILEQAKAAAGPALGTYVKTLDCLADVAVDTKSTPPKAALGAKAANYDGVCCLVYSYAAGKVTLNMYMLKVKTGECVWTYKLETVDPNTQQRLSRHGHYVPSTLKAKFYRFR